MRRLLALVAASALVLAACSGDDDDAADDDATATSTTDATVASTTTGPAASTTLAPTTTIAACEPGAPPTTAATGGNTSEPGLLRDLTTEAGDCTDRIDFTFDTEVPGFSIDYEIGPFTQDGSGAQVAIEGRAFLVVRFEPAHTVDFEGEEQTYTGPRELMPRGIYVQEIENTGDFEAVMTWIVGLSEAASYAATVAGGTLSIVIGNPR